jgi:Fe-S cluster biogenesis protein NfuA
VRTQVQDVIDDIRPVVQADGADIALVSVDPDAGLVVVDLHVPGYGCATSTAPLLAGVERIMRDRVPGVASVVQECGADATCDTTAGPCRHHHQTA